MGSNANHSYTEAAETGFWTAKNRPVVLGDVLGRVPTLDLVNPEPGQLILDAGCGAGYMARRYTQRGAKVVGVDINAEMLNAAKAINQEDRLPIFYTGGDIAETDFGVNMFDSVTCVAVLFHLRREEIGRFFRAAQRALRKGGKLVISFTSVELMEVASGRDIGWVAYSNVKEVDGTSVMRTEHYKNSVGQTFVADVWGHKTKDLLALLGDAGFDQRPSTYQRMVTTEALTAVGVTGETGFVGFEQIIVSK